MVSFVCEATGAPPPRIVWLHDQLPLTDISEHTDPVTRMTTSVVTLPAVGAGESGVYLCRAVNEVDGVAVGQEEADATLTVIGECVFVYVVSVFVYVVSVCLFCTQCSLLPSPPSLQHPPSSPLPVRDSPSSPSTLTILLTYPARPQHRYCTTTCYHFYPFIYLPHLLTSLPSLSPLPSLSLLPSLPSSPLSPPQEGAELQFSWEKDGSPLDLSDDRLSLSHGNTSSNISFSMVTEADSGKYVCSVRTLYEGLEAPGVHSFAINVTATPGQPVHSLGVKL